MALVQQEAEVRDAPNTYQMGQRVLQEFGHLDILINNAGITSDTTFQKMDHAAWERVTTISFDGVLHYTKVLSRT